MKVIIAGCRDCDNWELVATAVKSSGFAFTEVVSGGAKGVDYLGESLAQLHGYPVKVFPADWKTYGAGAGPRRNREMAKYADALVAVWDRKSPGTKNMIEEMQKRKKPIFIMYIPEVLNEQS